MRALPGAAGPRRSWWASDPRPTSTPTCCGRAAGSLARAAKRHASLSVDLLGALPDGANVATAPRRSPRGSCSAATSTPPSSPTRSRRSSAAWCSSAAGASGPRPAIERGLVLAEAVAWARDLVNEPGGSLTPTKLAQQAAAAGTRAGFEVTVWDEKEIRKEKLGGLLGVNRGSDQAPAVPAPRVRARQATRHRRARGQGHHVRLRRPVAEAVRRHDRDEGRHGRCRRGARHVPGHRRARRQGPGARLPPDHRQHDRRRRHPRRRRAHHPQRHHGGGAQHRRRGSAHPGRRPLAGHRGRARRHRRPGHPHRRLHGGAR